MTVLQIHQNIYVTFLNLRIDKLQTNIFKTLIIMNNLKNSVEQLKFKNDIFIPNLDS